jgi:cell wall assembly regulator SMI1
MTEIPALMEQLKAILDQKAANRSSVLQTGATLEQIQQLEQTIGSKLPEDYKTALRIANGQDPGEDYIFDGREFLSAERVADEWKVWKDLFDKGTFSESNGDVEADAEIQPYWWHPAWIPITYDGSGNHDCLDLAPTEKGTYGQVICMYHDDSIRKVQAVGFTRWLANYIEKLKSD